MNHLRKYWRMYLGYVIYAIVVAFIFSQGGCASKFETLRNGNTIVIKPKKVRMWTGPNCYYCDKAKEWFKTNNIQYTERNFNCTPCQSELFSVADQLRFNKAKIDGVPVIVIDSDKLMIGFSPGQLNCVLLNKGCSKRVYNIYLDRIRIKK